VEHVDCFCGQC